MISLFRAGAVFPKLRLISTSNETLWPSTRSRMQASSRALTCTKRSLPPSSGMKPSLHSIKANELVWRSGGILLDHSVNEGAVAFFPREAALVCCAFFVASIGSGSIRFATVVTGPKPLLAFIQAGTINSRYRRPNYENDRNPLAATKTCASHVLVPFSTVSDSVSVPQVANAL